MKLKLVPYLLLATFSSVSYSASNTCKTVSNSMFTWYECNGVKITQSYDSKLNGDTISNFKIYDNKAVWRYSNRGLTKSEHAYYSNTLDGKNLQIITQKATNWLSSDVETIQHFKIVDNKFAIWKLTSGTINQYPGHSEEGYYINTLDNASIYPLTQKATQSPFYDQALSNFKLEANRAIWRYTKMRPFPQTAYYGICLDLNEISNGISENHQITQSTSGAWDIKDFKVRQNIATWSYKNDNNLKELLSCTNSATPPIQTPNPAFASVNNNSINVSWNSVKTAKYYLVSIEYNSAGWSDFKYKVFTPKISWTNLNDGTRRYKIKACRNDGCSNSSIASNYVTTYIQPSKLTTPKNIIAKNTNHTITLNWDKVNNAEYYMIAIKFNSNPWTAHKYRANHTSLSWEGLNPGSRQYKVKACKKDQCYDASQPSNIIVNN